MPQMRANETLCAERAQAIWLPDRRVCGESNMQGGAFGPVALCYSPVSGPCSRPEQRELIL